MWESPWDRILEAIAVVAFGAPFAIAGGLLVGLLVVLLTIGMDQGRERAMRLAFWFPAVSLAWIIFANELNGAIAPYEPGEAKLPNGYSLRSNGENGVLLEKSGLLIEPVDSSEFVYGVTRIQLADRYVLGASRDLFWLHDPDHYFLLDISKRTIVHFSRYDGLVAAAAARGIPPKLEPADMVYDRYAWRERLLPWAMLGPPAVVGALGLLALLWIRLRLFLPAFGKQALR